MKDRGTHLNCISDQIDIWVGSPEEIDVYQEVQLVTTNLNQKD